LISTSILKNRQIEWLDFCLKGEEDPDPAKAEQYARWRELRKLQQQNEEEGHRQ